jgi:hypothetical protein
MAIALYTYCYYTVVIPIAQCAAGGEINDDECSGEFDGSKVERRGLRLQRELLERRRGEGRARSL